MELPEAVQAKLQQALVVALAGLLALILLCALLIASFVMLLMALTSGLAPVVGDSGAYAIAGLGCLLVLLLVFRRLTAKRKTKPRQQSPLTEGSDDGSTGAAPLDDFRQTIREHPWESVATSFALGLVQSGDPRLRELLMDSSLVWFKSAQKDDGKAPGSASATGEEAGSAPGRPDENGG